MPREKKSVEEKAASAADRGLAVSISRCMDRARERCVSLANKRALVARMKKAEKSHDEIQTALVAQGFQKEKRKVGVFAQYVKENYSILLRDLQHDNPGEVGKDGKRRPLPSYVNVEIKPAYTSVNKKTGVSTAHKPVMVAYSKTTYNKKTKQNTTTYYWNVMGLAGWHYSNPE